MVEGWKHKKRILRPNIFRDVDEVKERLKGFYSIIIT